MRFDIRFLSLQLSILFISDVTVHTISFSFPFILGEMRPTEDSKM